MTTNTSRIVALLFIASLPQTVIAEESPATNVFATPESVVAAFHRANQKKDWLAEVRLGTPRYREAGAVTVVFASVWPFPNAELQAIIARHCADLEPLKQLRKDLRKLSPDDPELEAKLTAVEHEMLGFLKRNEVDNAYLLSEVSGHVGSRRRNYRIVKQSIKIDRDTASVRIRSEHEEAQKSDGKTVWKPVGGLTLLFLRKTDAGWRIDLDDDEVKSFERIRNPNRPKPKPK